MTKAYGKLARVLHVCSNVHNIHCWQRQGLTEVTRIVMIVTLAIVSIKKNF